MGPMIAVVSSDWHIERHAWAKHPTLCGDSYYGLSQLVDFCVTHSLPLIAAGDLFNEPYPEAHSVWHVARQMDRMKAAGLPVYFVQGQHEYSRDTPWMNAFHDWPTHVDKKVFSIGRIKFYGLDFVRGRDACQAELAKVPAGTDALVAHQVWEDIMGVKASPEAKLADVPNAHLVLTGDYHKHFIFKSMGKDNQDIRLVSPGPLCMQSLGEESQKAFWVLHEDFLLTTEKLKCREVFNFTLRNNDELKYFEKNWERLLENSETIPEVIRKPIFDVEFDESISGAYDRIVKAVGDKVHLFWSAKRAGKTLVHKTDEIAKTNKLNLEQHLDELCGRDRDTFDLALSLITSKDPVGLLKELTEKELGVSK